MYKILVADNDETTQVLLREILPSDSYKIEAAHNGKEVLKKVSDGSVDILIIEVHIPGNEDYGITPQVQKLSRRTRIIAIAEGNSLEAQRILRSGENPVFFYALKPLAAQEIRLAVDSAARDIEKNELPLKPGELACQAEKPAAEVKVRTMPSMEKATSVEESLLLKTAAGAGRLVGRARKGTELIGEKISAIAKWPLYLIKKSADVAEKGINSILRRRM